MQGHAAVGHALVALFKKMIQGKEMSEEEAKRAVKERAIEILNLSGNCAQSSFATLQEIFDLDSKDILKALTPFPGLALRGEVCGAVIGALMALGLVYGREDLSNKRGYVASLPSARRFCAKFSVEFGSTSCTSILESKLGKNFDLASSKGSQEYLLAGGQKVCGEVVGRAVEIAAELIKKRIK
jgi:C_GCAxxG_C_C family probable redox protein